MVNNEQRNIDTLEAPRRPGEFYPTGPDVVPQMLDILAKQVASPVQFIKGLRTLYEGLGPDPQAERPLIPRPYSHS